MRSLVLTISTLALGCATAPPSSFCGFDQAQAVSAAAAGPYFRFEDPIRKWNDTHLTWYVVDEHPDAWSSSQIQAALERWDTESLFTFTPVASADDANIRIFHRHYGDTGWAGLASFPPLDGDGSVIIRINLDVAGTGSPFYYERLIRHEIGHTLGLRHPPQFWAMFDIMNPGVGTTFALMYDSRAGLRELYE